MLARVDGELVVLVTGDEAGALVPVLTQLAHVLHRDGRAVAVLDELVADVRQLAALKSVADSGRSRPQVTTSSASSLVTVTTAALLRGQPARTLRDWASSGRLDGAVKVGRAWMVPLDVVLSIEGKN